MALTSVHIVNLFHNPEWFGIGSFNIFPSLMQTSQLYDLVTNTEVVPSLHLVVQGWPVPGIAHNDVSRNFPLSDVISAEHDPDPKFLQEAQLRSLAGNSMHWASIGAFVLFALATSFVPIPSDPSEEE